MRIKKPKKLKKPKIKIGKNPTPESVKRAKERIMHWKSENTRREKEYMKRVHELQSAKKEAAKLREMLRSMR